MAQFFAGMDVPVAYQNHNKRFWIFGIILMKRTECSDTNAPGLQNKETVVTKMLTVLFMIGDYGDWKILWYCTAWIGRNARELMKSANVRRRDTRG